MITIHGANVNKRHRVQVKSPETAKDIVARLYLNLQRAPRVKCDTYINTPHTLPNPKAKFLFKSI